ncbi:hypothetical protein F4814DRAFT_55138 [Daldinia grandis]|nr:hypothetical protein F4814DRAFT_55138 [Daldinia grandis]
MMNLTDANEKSAQDSNNTVDNGGADEPNTDDFISIPLNPGHSDTVAAENESNQPAENRTILTSPNIEFNAPAPPESEEPEDSAQAARESDENNLPSPPASDSSYGTLVGSEDSYRSSVDASISIPPHFASISARAEVNSLGCALISAQFSSNTSGSTDTSSESVFYSQLETLHSMNHFSASANATTRTGSVRFSTFAVVQHPDGTTSQQPTNLPPSSPPQPPMSDPPQPEPDPAVAAAAAAAAAPPPGGPPPNPPVISAAAASPDPNQNAAFPPFIPLFSASTQPAATVYPPFNPPGMSNIVPPIGPGAGPAIPNFGGSPVIILSGTPAPAPASTQAAPFSNMNVNSQQQQQQQYQQQQPYLWVNPPMVAPSVPAPQPGTQGSWCYPSQSPFWAGALADQTNLPPQFYTAEQAYVAEPAYIVGAAPQPPPPPPPPPPPSPQVQYYVNGTTGPFVYYMQ